MPLVLADRVQESTTTTGTGDIVLNGALAQFQSFAVGIGVGNTTYYGLISGDGENWEVGIGTVGGSAGAYVLARTTVLSSSNGNALIALSGTSSVFCDLPASRVGAAKGAPTQVQSATARSALASSTSVTVTFPANTTVGNMVLFIVAGFGNATAATITPPAGVYPLYVDRGTTLANEQISVFVARIYSAAESYTFAISGPNGFMNVLAVELSGAQSFHGQNWLPVASGDNVSFMPLLTDSGGLYYGAMQIDNAQTITSFPAGVTEIAQLGAGSGNHSTTFFSFTADELGTILTFGCSAAPTGCLAGAVQAIGP